MKKEMTILEKKNNQEYKHYKKFESPDPYGFRPKSTKSIDRHEVKGIRKALSKAMKD